MTANGKVDSAMIVFEKARLNVWNVGAVIVGTMVTAFGWGFTYAGMTASTADLQKQITEINTTLEKAETTRKDRIKTTDDNFTAVRAQLGAILELRLRLDRQIEIAAEAKTAITATNARVDRVVESFGGKLDTLNENVSKLATRVEVIASKIDANNAQPQKTKYNQP